MIKCVVFDLDGTLLNTLLDLTDSLNRTLEIKAFPKRTVEEVRRALGDGVEMLIRRSVPENTSEKDVKFCFDFFKDYYHRHSDIKTAPYEGIIPLLTALKAKGIKVAILSNKLDEITVSLSRKYFGSLVDLAVGQKENIRKKPSSESVEYVLEKLKISKEEAVYVGDSEVDAQTGLNSKIKTYCVTWGFRDKEELLKYKLPLASAAEELKKYLLDE